MTNSCLGISKAQKKDPLLKEAKYINLSLHYLEHVIICLNKKAQGENVHIPYRNSLLTLFLRDSLGGNSKTRVIATVNMEEADIEETIPTCKFLQRVALVKKSSGSKCSDRLQRIHWRIKEE